MRISNLNFAAASLENGENLHARKKKLSPISFRAEMRYDKHIFIT